MRNQFQEFLKLHHQDEPLLIANAWNVQSARVFEKLGFKALATSSYAIAETLGYADGEQMSFDEYLFIIKRILASIAIPVSVDLEAGYGKTASEIVNNIRQLHALGVSGINIEDSLLVDGKRTMVDAIEFADLLRTIVGELSKAKIEIYINLRSDPFLLNVENALTEAKKRITIYNTTGVNGLFLPCATKQEDIIEIVKAATLPVNVLAMPTLPDFKQLQQFGVKRISMGSALNTKLYKVLKAEAEGVLTDQSFARVF